MPGLLHDFSTQISAIFVRSSFVVAPFLAVVGATMTRLKDLAISSFLNLLSMITSEKYIQYVGK